MSEIANQPVLLCPHCNEYIIIEQINCAIFRHGVLKENGQQIEPHSVKELCEYYINNNLIYGCGKPFKIIFKNGIFETEICGYI
jgi:hypothetical protein